MIGELLLVLKYELRAFINFLRRSHLASLDSSLDSYY